MPERETYWDGADWIGYTPSLITPPPPPPTPRWVGVYNGAPSEGPDAATLLAFGAYPQVGSTYYQGNNATNITYESGRIGRGTRPLLTKTTRGGTTTLQDIAAENTAGTAWLTSWINDLKTLSLVNTDIEVMATIDHEAEVKFNQGNLSAADWAAYPAALSVFIRRCRAEAPLVKTLYWYGGSDTTKIATVLAGLTENPHYIVMDPYRFASHPSSETFIESVGDEISWLRGRSDYTRLGSPPIGLSEFGTSMTQFTDANNAAWFTGLRDDMETLDIFMAVLFNRDSSTYAYKINSYPLSVAAFSAELTH